MPERRPLHPVGLSRGALLSTTSAVTSRQSIQTGLPHCKLGVPIWVTATLSAYPVKGEGGIAARAIASGLRCSRGSYRQHATKGSNANKGDPSGSGATHRARQRGEGRKGRMTGGN